MFNTSSLADTQMVFDALLANETGWAAPKQADILLLAAFGLMILLYSYLLRLFDGAVAALEKMPMWLWFIPLTLALVLIIVLAPSGIPGFIYADF